MCSFDGRSGTNTCAIPEEEKQASLEGQLGGREWCQEPLLTRIHRRQIKRWFLTPFYFGKAKKVALTASMRKLLTILNAMLKHRTPWHKVEASHA